MPLLHHEPRTVVDTLDTLLSIALALEEESVGRYTQLAALMDRRGEAEIATIFRTLAAEEKGHATGVSSWARTLGLTAIDAPAFVWSLPPEIATSWEALTERTHMTPYQALSLAVVNEQRAFAFYSYIAANTGDEEVRRHAEKLALEELRHAALVRRERRKAYRRQGGATADKPMRAGTPEEFAALAATLLSAASAQHAAAAKALAERGAADDAALVSRIAEEEIRLAAPFGATAPPPPSAILSGDILRGVMAVSERLSEAFADIADTASDESVLNGSQRLLQFVIGHLAALSARGSAPSGRR
jgi:rubrerythrin